MVSTVVRRSWIQNDLAKFAHFPYGCVSVYYDFLPQSKHMYLVGFIGDAKLVVASNGCLSLCEGRIDLSIQQRPGVSWCNIYLWTLFCLKMVFIMDKLHRSPIRELIGFRSGRRFLQIALFLPTWAMKSPSSSKESPDGASSSTPSSNWKKAGYSELFFLAHKHKWNSGPVHGQRSKSLVHWQKLQCTGSRLRGYKNIHSSPPPVSKGNS